MKHLDCKIYQCDHCNRKFFTEGGAQRHVKIHCAKNPRSLKNDKSQYDHLLGIPLFRG